jgi:hypothetical protein
MKNVSTATVKSSKKIAQQKLTVGLDRRSVRLAPLAESCERGEKNADSIT